MLVSFSSTFAPSELSRCEVRSVRAGNVVKRLIRMAGERSSESVFVCSPTMVKYHWATLSKSAGDISAILNDSHNSKMHPPQDLPSAFANSGVLKNSCYCKHNPGPRRLKRQRFITRFDSQRWLGLQTQFPPSQHSTAFAGIR